MPTSPSSSSSSEHRFVEQEGDDEAVWAAKAILKERKHEYLIDWVGIDPQTGKPWEPSWVLKQNVTEGLKKKWKEGQAALKKSKSKSKSMTKTNIRTEASGKGSRSRTTIRASASTSTGMGATRSMASRRRREKVVVSDEEEEEEPSKPHKKTILPKVTPVKRGGRRSSDSESDIFLKSVVPKVGPPRGLKRKRLVGNDTESKSSKRTRTGTSSTVAESILPPNGSPKPQEPEGEPLPVDPEQALVRELEKAYLDYDPPQDQGEHEEVIDDSQATPPNKPNEPYPSTASTQQADVDSQSQAEVDWTVPVQETKPEVPAPVAPPVSQESLLLRHLKEHILAMSRIMSRQAAEIKELQVQLEGARGDGRKMVMQMYDHRIKRLEGELIHYKMKDTILAQQDQRTNDAIRKKAAEEPELRHELAALYKDPEIEKVEEWYVCQYREGDKDCFERFLDDVAARTHAWDMHYSHLVAYKDV